MDLPNNDASTNEKSQKYIAVDLVFDEKTQYLQAVLSETNKDPNLSFMTLQKMLKDNRYESFRVDDSVLQDIIQKADNQEVGRFNLAQKPVFIDVALKYNDETKKLSAVLTHTEEEVNHTIVSVQSLIQKEGYQDFDIKTPLLQKLMKQINDKNEGVFEIGEKPEFTGVELSFDEDTNHLYAVLKSIERKINYTKELLQQDIKAKKYHEFYFEEGILEGLLKKINANQHGRHLIGQRKDASVKITVSNDEMKAYLTTFPPYGGHTLSLSELELELKEKGIDQNSWKVDVLKEVVQKEIVEDVLFAEGQMPVDGDDTTFEPLVQSIVELKPTADDKGKVDFYQVRDYTNVEPNTPLMVRKPPTSGVNGFDVYGKVVPAVPGKEIPFSPDSTGTIIDPNDGNKLLANKKGYPVILENGVRIEDILVLDDVNLTTGNINYEGSVLIKGSVHSGMIVDVTGDVTVNDSINNAIIKAGNNITLEAGIMGTEKKDKNKPLTAATKEDEVIEESYNAKLIAGGCIKANFISGTEVKAKGHIEVREYIAHSKVESEDHIYVGQEGGKGQIMGGRTLSKKGMKLKIAGASASVKTRLTVGYTAKVKQRYKELKQAILEKEEELKQICYLAKKQVENDNAKTTNDEREKFYQKLNNSLLRASQELEHLEQEFNEVKVTITTAIQEGVEIEEQTFTNVFLNINNTKLLIEDELKGYSKFVLKNEKIERLASQSKDENK